MLQKWTKLSSEVFHENKWWQGIHDRFRLPNGKEGDYFYMETFGGVGVVPIDEHGKIILVRQYRYLFDRVSLSFPGGGVKKGQTPEIAAAVELAEETNLKADKLTKIGFYNPYIGAVKENYYLFLATGLSSNILASDETEEIELVRLSPEEISEAIIKGEIWDDQTIANWWLAQNFLKK